MKVDINSIKFQANSHGNADEVVTSKGLIEMKKISNWADYVRILNNNLNLKNIVTLEALERKLYGF